MDPKKPWLSKTIILNVLVAVAAVFIPGANEWVQSNGVLVAGIMSGINVVLRLISKGKIELL